MSMRGMAGVVGENEVLGVEVPPLVLVVPAEVRFIMREDEKPPMGDLMLEEPEVREDLDCEVERMWAGLESTMGLGAFSRREKRPMFFAGLCVLYVGFVLSDCVTVAGVLPFVSGRLTVGSAARGGQQLVPGGLHLSSWRQ